MWGMGPYTVKKVIIKLCPRQGEFAWLVSGWGREKSNLFFTVYAGTDLNLTLSHVDSEVQLSYPRTTNADECFRIYSKGTTNRGLGFTYPFCISIGT
jgi:hypothetical protein